MPDDISLEVAEVLNNLRGGASLTEEQLAFLLTPAEVEAVLSWKKGGLFARRKISALIRAGLLRPAYTGGSHAYRYRLQDVLAVELRPRGRPRKST